MKNDKLKALVHFMIAQCQDWSVELGAIRLNRALWFADVAAYQDNKTSITGVKYIKQHQGPVPESIDAVLGELAAEGKIRIQQARNGFDVQKFAAVTPPNASSLNDYDRGIATTSLEALFGRSTNIISEMKHDLIWDIAFLGEEIPLYASYAANQGRLTDEIRTWAIAQMKQLQETK